MNSSRRRTVARIRGCTVIVVSGRPCRSSNYSWRRWIRSATSAYCTHIEGMLPSASPVSLWTRAGHHTLRIQLAFEGRSASVLLN